MSRPLAIVGLGAVTPVGWTAPQTCAAVRAALASFHETAFEINEPLPGPVVGAPAPLPKPPHRSPPFERLVLLASQAIGEALRMVPIQPLRAALLLATKEPSRSNPVVDRQLDTLIQKVESKLGVRFHAASTLVPEGNAAGFTALLKGRELLTTNTVDLCLIAGVDSFLNRADLKHFGDAFRIKNAEVTHGFIPGEAGTCVALARSGTSAVRPLAEVLGVGVDTEPAGSTVHGDGPATGRALQAAIRLACEDAGVPESSIGFRISDVNGEAYRVSEMLLATHRAYRTRRARLSAVYPAASVGEVGAAVVPLSMALAVTSFVKGYAPGDVAAIEASSDMGRRGACLIRRI